MVDRFGICMVCVIFEMILGWGYNWDGLRLCELGVLVWGLSVYFELGGVLFGSCIFKNFLG